MIVYRITRPHRAGDLSGEGSRLYGGRWNQRGTPAVYCSSTIALALLEVLVHVVDRRDLPAALTITSIEVANAELLQTLAPAASGDATQEFGTDVLHSDEPGFWVPSVVVPQERNLVLNPQAPRFGSAAKVIRTEALPIDARLRG